MEFILFRFFALVSVAFVVSHAAVSTEDYWRSVLPDIPMPKSISELLPSAVDQHISKGGVAVKSEIKGKSVNVGVKQNTFFFYDVKTDQHNDNDGAAVESRNKGKLVNDGVKPNTFFFYDAKTDQHTGKDGATVESGNKGKLVNAGVRPNTFPFYDAKTHQVYDDPSASLFFLEKDLQQGTNMNLHFTKSTTPTSFLPQNVADSIPFSSKKLPEILTKLSIKENTSESKTIKNTIDICEAPGNKGEEKSCATSLENMIEFTTSKLGKKVNAVSTDVQGESKMQNYKLVGSTKLGEQAVVCHKHNYPYAVFYCHKTDNVKAYTVLLVGNNGTKAKAAAICHMDTSSWNPKHMAFQILNVKPGSVPVCHFLPEDHVLWVPYILNMSA